MSDSRKVTSSKSLAVVECKLIGSNGEIRDLKEPLIFNNIQIYESIYSPVVTGTIQLVEGVNLYSLLAMHGSEYLYISFCRPGETESDGRYTRTFRIYKSDLRKPSARSQVQTYVLHFCSEELVFSNQQTISRSYSGRSSSEYIYNILVQDLKTNKKRVRNFEKSQGIHDYVLTKYKPFEAIEQFAKYSYNENESPFLFFENRDGYNFISLEKLFKQAPIQPALNYSTAKITYEQSESPFKNANEIKQFEFEQSFDILENTKNGAYASRLYTLDLIRQKFTKHDYSLANKLAQESLLDGFLPINNAQNRNNKPIYEEYNAQPNYWLTNLSQNETPYFLSKGFRTTNIDVEKFLLQRKTQLNLLNNTRVWCNVPGNPNYSVGYIVEFNMPSFIPNSTDDRALDPYHSGKYLITSIRHSITPDDIETVMVLNKNSVSAPLDNADNGNSSYKTARQF